MRLTALRAFRQGPLRRLAGEQGFTMITAMGALFVISLLSAAAIAAANGDIRLSRDDQDDKQAYAAAEAGINDYLAHLNQDSDYWARCAGEDATKPLSTPNAVNQELDGAGNPIPGQPPRKWRNVPGANSRYSIELVPAPGKSACDPADPIGSMIDGDGNFRIRSTGEVMGKRNKRAIVATFRRTGFLDFLYFTDLENQDPTYLTLNLGGLPTRSTDSNGNPNGGPDLYAWAGDKCEHHWWGTQAEGEGRSEMPKWHGQFLYGGSWITSTGFDLDTNYVCGEITFANQDKVNGPFHSNDDFLVCGSPDFGRSGKNDRVETSGDGWRGCSGSNPDFFPALTTKARRLDLPPSNASLKRQVDAGYLFTGPTTLRINGTNVTVTNGGSTTTKALPPSGVIYVESSACTYGYKPGDTDYLDPGCGVARVSGNYNKDLTISAEDDVIVDGNLTRTSGGSAVLGLIANNFVRVWHPTDGQGGSCANRSGTPTNVTIDAAILSLKHSFTVDNYGCGAPLGTLTVNGVIAQKHRGIVGTGGATINTGYTKSYNYDDRLKYRSPPHFLDPVQASWRVLRQNEQSPAR